MRRASFLIAAGGLALVLAAPAARSLPFTGTLSLIVGALPPVAISGAGSGPSIGGGGAGITSGGFAGTTTVALVNATFPFITMKIGTPAGITALSATAGGAVGGGCAGGPGISGAGKSDCSGLFGVVKIGLFSGPPPVANLSIPLGVLGAGGTSMATGFPGGVVTAMGSGWTTGVAKVVGTTNPTVPTIDFVTGADLRSPGGQGTIVLVSPVLVTTFQPGITNLPVFGVLTLNYVPEPGTLLLLGSGVAGLGVLGRRRLRGQEADPRRVSRRRKDPAKRDRR